MFGSQRNHRTNAGPMMKVLRSLAVAVALSIGLGACGADGCSLDPHKLRSQRHRRRRRRTLQRMNRATQIHAVLAVNPPDSDHPEPFEGIPATFGPGGLLLPMVHLNTTPRKLEGILALAQRAVRQGEVPAMRLEVVKFTLRHHVAWIEP